MKAFASDFDGTLYFMFQEESLKEVDVKAIKAFQKKGHLFGICTGRSQKGITDVVEDISFDFYILVSGALLLDRDFTVISKTCISYELMENIFRLYENEVLSIIQANDTVYSLVEERPLLEHIDSLEEMKGSDIYGLSFGSKSQERAKEIAQEINDKYGEEINAYANVKNVDIVAKGCSKGAAIRMIKERYGIEDMGGIGDSYNDIPMLKESDASYTFPYAPAEAKNQVDDIVENVAEALEKFLMREA